MVQQLVKTSTTCVVAPVKFAVDFANKDAISLAPDLPTSGPAKADQEEDQDCPQELPPHIHGNGEQRAPF